MSGESFVSVAISFPDCDHIVIVSSNQYPILLLLTMNHLLIKAPNREIKEKNWNIQGPVSDYFNIIFAVGINNLQESVGLTNYSKRHRFYFSC